MRLLHRLRPVGFQRALVALGISFPEHRQRLAGTGGEDRKKIARAGTSDWVECDEPEMESVTALRIRLTMISYGSVNRMREFGSTAYLGIFAVTFRRERVRMDGAENQRVR